MTSQQLLGQFKDDFSDNDFTNTPSWYGTDSFFVVEDLQLKLRAPEEEGIAYLSTPCLVDNDAIWEFKVTMEFNPSASNYARIYIASDQRDLSGSLNGYFVLMGDSKDDISLYRQSAITTTKVIDGRDGILDLANVTAKIRVIRNGKGEWSLFSDVGTTGSYAEEGSAIDSTPMQSTTFGMYCKYTSTRSTKFSFDDIVVERGLKNDTIPPTLDAVEVISSNDLRLIFSESLDESSALILENYAVDNSIGHPKSSALRSDKKTLDLSFGKSFFGDTNFTISITGLRDANGNEMADTKTQFIFVPAISMRYRDVVITELMADPSPPIGLPDAEFVELYNRTERAIDLSEWTLSDPTTEASIPKITIPPASYLVISSKPSIPGVENIIALDNFPSLNNASDILVLKNSNGLTVDSISYNTSWYNDEEKASGGWTLELIDPNNICHDKQNWTSSENVNGGTPGVQNSVFGNNPDSRGPKLLSASIVSQRLELAFDEKLDKNLPSISSFALEPEMALNTISFSNLSFTKLELGITGEWQPGIAYTITAKGIYDCAGNTIEADFQSTTFGLPEIADTLDIVINELLFNPRATGVDFVEITNTSAKFINLKNWALATEENGMMKEIAAITQDNFLLMPGGYLAFTENSSLLKSEYILSDEKNLLEVDDLPSLNDDAGTLLLLDSSRNIIDRLIFNKDMHSVFIKDEEGVSLERISVVGSSSTNQNWKSASATVGFATPGYINSNSVPQVTEAENPMIIVPEIFNPLGGQPDFTQIHYNFDKGGYVANVKIFNPQGQAIKHLANNDILGTSGFYRWDGDRDDGTKASVGYYMIWFEVFDDGGYVKKFQKAIAIAAQF